MCNLDLLNIFEIKVLLSQGMYVVSYASSWNSFESGLSVSEPQQRSRSRGDETNRRTRAKPQWIVGQAYSHTYSTLSQLSRLQTICLGDSSKF